MYVIKQNHNFYELLIETIDDLWVLSQIISSNDTIFAKTKRKVRIGETDKNYKTITKLMRVDLKVNIAIYQNEYLRVSGEILNENEFTKKGVHHSLKYKIGDKIKFQKFSPFLRYQQTLFRNAKKNNRDKNLLIMIEREKSLILTFNEQKYKIIQKVSLSGTSKYIACKEDSIEVVFSFVEKLSLENYDVIIIAGPSIYKERLQKKIKSKFKKRILLHSWLDIREETIPKLISSITENKIISENLLARESKFVEEFLKCIDLQRKYAYGKEIFKRIEDGSVEILLITTKYIETKKEENVFSEINQFLIKVELYKGKIIIVDSKNESGHIIDNFGGIAGILRY